MCLKTTHRLAGAWTGALYGWHTGLPMWACAATAGAATLTSAGVLSPDVDQFKAWRRVDRWTPDELFGWGGPMKHRGLTHWPGWPVLAIHLLQGQPSSMLSVAVWALVLGWASHLLLDFIWGRAFGDRGCGVPLLGWTGYVGLGLDAGGKSEWVFGVVLMAVPFVLAWQAAT